MSIEENVIKHFKIIGLAGSEYAALIRGAAISGIQGGTIYDAVLLKAASKSGSEKIWTLNVKHFQTIASQNIRSQLAAR